MVALEIIERIKSKTKYVDNHWLFTGYIDETGHGYFTYTKGKHVTVSRLSAHVYLGLDLNDKLQKALHRDEVCRHKNCWNPEHLYVGTSKQNSQDAIRNKSWERSHCRNGHIYNNENTYITKKGWKQCRICKNESRMKGGNWTEEKGIADKSTTDNSGW
jgi:hypothetical protein